MPDGSLPNPAPQMPVSTMIEKYIALRDKKEKIQDAHKLQLRPYNEAMETLGNLIMGALGAAGLDSMKAEAGTAFTSTETSVSVKDWPETLGFIRERELWDLLEARVSKTAARAVIEETGEPIPGVNITQTSVLRVRRS